MSSRPVPSNTTLNNPTGSARGWYTRWFGDVPGGALFALGLLGFLTLASYEIARPTVEALYQQAYGSENEPWAWLGVAFFVTIVVSVYARLAAKLPLQRLLVWMIIAATLVLAALILLLRANVPGTPYMLYVWKDIYIVILIEMFWSIANSKFPLKTAKWLYGFFLVLGSVGAICGGRLAKFMSTQKLGFEISMWAVAGVLLLCFFASFWVPRADESPQVKKEKTDFLEGWRVVKGSQYLGLLLGIIAMTQIAITLVDYDFKVSVQGAYPDGLVRQGVLADVYSTINLSALILQIGAGVVIGYLGLRWTLIGVPIFILLVLAAFLITPVFAVMVVAKVASKAFDYSIFRAGKELLYLPLSSTEKTQGKAVVDMLTYRLAKGAASALLLGMKQVSAAPRIASIMAVFIVGIWILLTIPLLRRYGSVLTSKDQDTT